MTVTIYHVEALKRGIVTPIIEKTTEKQMFFCGLHLRIRESQDSLEYSN